ncbi:Ctr copper transporter family protein [Talaromyces stipitatus ATCC 10500]|uniref:Copper transport protein n=1 Tax=Talaromyces stipitatus (strain ATCC 10500 / CBS 375.48 / QM 6759 / NRRL 1006) TaxID=441959 RepID=B8MT60_TALSN|nr:Ctr copper transporter family protein [Talaromyces stipitatus ATCC 10500]EED12264.1 Ctr copper transporter family protein [Talaromyces stipitatus ATCC 10500]
MDHSHMDHGDMDMGHGGGKCVTNMLFTWSTHNMCIIFPEWRVQGTGSLLASLFAIILLTAGYEAVRNFTRLYEASHTQRLKAFSSSVLAGRDSKQVLERRGRLIMATLYAVQVFYSFFIMLLFMTYNGWVMISVAVGAFVGYLVFGGDAPATKSAACH